jgi:hypothetical protein
MHFMVSVSLHEYPSLLQTQFVSGSNLNALGCSQYIRRRAQPSLEGFTGVAVQKFCF